MTLPPKFPARRPHVAPLVWVLACALACSLLLAQTLGLMHAVVHGASHDGTPAPRVQAPVHDHVHGLDTPDDTGWLASLFSSHRDGDPDCRLFDQASHGSVLPAMAVLCLPMALSSLVNDISRGEALARWTALFDARGPPLTR